MTRVPFISVTQLFEMIEHKDPIVIVEVLGADFYALGHIPGAVSLPGAELAQRAAEVLPDKTKTIVTYCSNFQCHASTEAARDLLAMGYASVMDFKGGKKEWTGAGLPLQK